MIVPVKIDSVDSEEENMDIANTIRAFPNSSNFSNQLIGTIGSLMKSRFSSGLTQDVSSTPICLGAPNQTLAANTIKTRDNIYELIPEIHKDFSLTRYSCISMKYDSHNLTLHKISRDNEDTDGGDGLSKLEIFLQKIFLKKVAATETRMLNEDEPHNLHCEVIEIRMPSNIIDSWTKLEILLG